MYSVVKIGGWARQILHSHFMKSECRARRIFGVVGEVLPKAGAFGTGQIWLSTAQPSTLEETPRQF